MSVFIDAHDMRKWLSSILIRYDIPLGQRLVITAEFEELAKPVPSPLTARVTARLTDAVKRRWADGYGSASDIQLDLVQWLLAAIAPELLENETALQDAHRELDSERERRTIAQEACLGLHDTVKDAERLLREAEGTDREFIYGICGYCDDPIGQRAYVSDGKSSALYHTDPCWHLHLTDRLREAEARAERYREALSRIIECSDAGKLYGFARIAQTALADQAQGRQTVGKRPSHRKQP